MGSARTLSWLAAAVVALALVGCEQQARKEPTPPDGQKAAAAAVDFTLSGPYQHDNLAIYLVHGNDTVKGEAFLTLEEALAKKVLVVHETGNVGELTVDNVSETESIFIQSGDIVSGGKQDRCLGLDLVVPPNTKGVKLASFCVEQGRWSARGGEATGHFYTKSNRLSSRELKLSAFKGRSQGEVWNYVGRQQAALVDKVEGYQLSPASPTSW